MILEQAVLDVTPGKQQEFELAFEQAQNIIMSKKGYISHCLQKCIEKDNRYLLMVQWQTLEDHTIGFRQSPDYKKWKALLHHFYQPFPEVAHYQALGLK
ncbi:antibiotic biosynthesis monooxygenase [uncultured Paraglaciecola sp.]|uniref:antibiotic biosynthesis monooxygenase family protein n=1 Tax=uncultured Paraglaciecola sp. TaxID=1765024 RepID=UPI0025DDCA59|nr:antibiotic biosynthesis monooxygenase [uncultured Paraglaciecola sp.]